MWALCRYSSNRTWVSVLIGWVTIGWQCNEGKNQNTRDGQYVIDALWAWTITGSLKQIMSIVLAFGRADRHCAFVTNMHSILCKSLLSSDEQHSAQCQLFIICHQYHLVNDLFQLVAMVMVICMEMVSDLVEGEETVDIGHRKKEVWPQWKEDTCCRSSVHSVSSQRCSVLLMSMSASREHCGSMKRTRLCDTACSEQGKVQESL